MHATVRLIALPLALLGLAGCVAGAPAIPTPVAQDASRASARSPLATVLSPEAVPPALIADVLPAAQKTADDASRRREIDFFNLHANPIGLRLGQGEEAAYVLSFLGTAKTRADLNLELRAFRASGQDGFHFNYSGPVTLGLEAPPAPPARVGGAGYGFELIFGLPGNGVAEAYERYMNGLTEHLVRRYQARPFAFDDAPIVLAVHRGEEVVGFVFTNQGNRLVLGDRKYADVQQVVFLSTEAEVVAGYTLIGFNPKTAGPAQPPVYRLSSHARWGTLAEFGEK